MPLLSMKPYESPAEALAQWALDEFGCTEAVALDKRTVRLECPDERTAEDVWVRVRFRLAYVLEVLEQRGLTIIVRIKE